MEQLPFITLNHTQSKHRPKESHKKKKHLIQIFYFKDMKAKTPEKLKSCQNQLLAS